MNVPMDLTNYRISSIPFYHETSTEKAIFEAAAASRLPIMLKGPTGCGKTRFVEHMAWQLGRPLITVACHEDMTAADLAGRFLLTAEGTVWHDGPLTLAVRHGAICYLDEVVEARQDTTVVIHPLADNRRILPLDRKGELVTAHPDFLLVVSYNPGYQSAVKDLKESTKQRFVAIDFTYPAADAEGAIVAREADIEAGLARMLVDVAASTRNLRGRGLNEGASTRMIVHAGRLIGAGVSPRDALRAAVALPLTDDADMREALDAIIAATAS
jgi:nitric oxide reductase NorQ protein